MGSLGWPARPVVYGDIVADLIASTEQTLGVPCFGSIPSPLTDGPFVVMQLVGGGPATQISIRPRVMVDCWAPTDPQAHDLCQQVAAHLRSLIGPRPDSSVIKRVEITAQPAFTPDVESRQPRFRLTANIHVTSLRSPA